MEPKMDSVVIRFSGDSGDGMQLTGTQFSATSAVMGNDIATFPDYPSEIRAPSGTIAGVSGFQIQFGASEVDTPGDEPDVLVAMNAAALKANLAAVRKGGTLVLNVDAFSEKDLEKAGYDKCPIATQELNQYKVIEASITSQTMEALKDVDIPPKSKARCKNFYALGITYFMFGRDLEPTKKWLRMNFAKKPLVVEANVKALEAGFHFMETLENPVSTYKIAKAKIKPGTYRQINGNQGTAWGLMAAAEKAKLPLFCGSYPITPATDILQELAKFKHFGVKTYQAEDEIAGICSSIGASFAGNLATTTTSGPGLALKSEAIGLAVIMELPLVIVNVQRGGPSTGLPTKTEQSDLMQALWGRNGECPAIVVAASRPNDCFYMAYEAARLSLKHMTPVILLTDGYIANGMEPFRIPKMADMAAVENRLVDADNEDELKKFMPYARDSETLARPWAIPGMKGFEHRVGGLEKKNLTGAVCHDPFNHQEMSILRESKVEKVANFIPEQKLEGEDSGDVLVVSWGGTYGSTHKAVKRMRKAGKKVSLMHLKYINPMPRNVGDIIKRFKTVLVCELNLGQMKNLLNMRYQCGAKGLNKIQGLPFKVAEITAAVDRELENLN